VGFLLLFKVYLKQYAVDLAFVSVVVNVLVLRLADFVWLVAEVQ
jgi:hypothetical protein